MTAIIIVNWNGADDTIACLRSLDNAKGDFMVVVADNGSTDDSINRIDSVIKELKIKVDLLPLGRNWGFAVGNNRGIQYSRKYNPDSYMLLNNDTEVEPDFLVKIEGYRKQHPEIKVLGPLIRYWFDRDRIWSCGGKLVFGSRKAYYKDMNTNVLKTSVLPVTFISGCALFADVSLLDPDGCLLTERFFFGEEDFEFAHRMRRNNVKMAILTDSVIYHKVGSSAKRMSSRAKLGRDYLYYLGRLIVVRKYYNSFAFAVVLLLSYTRCLRHFMQDGLDIKMAIKVVNRLLCDAKTKEGFDYFDFMSIINGSIFDNT